MCRRFKIFSGLLFAFVLSFFFYSSTYAVDDVVLHINQDTEIGAGIDLCSTAEDCSQYSYFIYKPIDVSNYANNTYSWVRYYSSGNFDFYFSKVVSDSVFTFSSVSRIFLAGMRNDYIGNYSFDLILTNTPEDYVDFISSGEDCPVCEECQECPAVPENPYDEKLDNITQAIYVCAAVVLVVYFFYCIYRMLIKNFGVK